MSDEPMRLGAEAEAHVRDHNATSGRAPCCLRCAHMLVIHGAGRCGARGCECPSDEFAWGIPDSTKGGSDD